MNTSLKQLIDKYLGYLLIAIFLPPTRLLGIMLKRDHTLQQSPGYILFIKILGLGSLVVSSEAIRIMRKKYPNARFILLTDENIARGIKPFHLFDELWTIKSGNIFSVLTGSVRFLARSWRLKKIWVVDLEVYSKLTTVYALMTFALNRFGFYLGPVFFRKYLNTHNVHFDQKIFLEDNYRKMAQDVVLEEVNPGKLNKPRRADERAKKYIAVNNTCSDLALVRKLPESVFAEICQWILENTSYHLALLGSPGDTEQLHQFLQKNSILKLQQGKIKIAAGFDSFESYYKFLSEECVCVLTIDSGPLHIARALNLPTVSVWGPTNPANYLKVSSEEEHRHLYHYNKVHCSPCVHLVTKLPCGGDNFCMKKIEAGIIIEKIKRLLANLDSPAEA